MEAVGNADGCPRSVGVFATLGSVALATWLLGWVIDVVLLAFAGVLLGLFLRGSADWLAARTKLPPRWGVAAVCLTLIASMAAFLLLAAPSVGREVEELVRRLPRALDTLRASLEGQSWGRWLLERTRDSAHGVSGRDALGRAGGLFSSTAGALASVIVFLFVGLFVALDPETYRDGMLRLVPLHRRARARFVLGRTADIAAAVDPRTTRRHGRHRGADLARARAPRDPVRADPGAPRRPADLHSELRPRARDGAAPPCSRLMEGPERAAYVVALYFGVQTVESYVLTPLLQKQTTSLPPALTLVAQVVMASLAGGLGVVVATPLTAVALVTVRHLYVEDALGDRDDADERAPRR
jgi:predicted PurR-regulated permease PerM